MVGLKLVEHTKVTQILAIKNLKYTPDKAKKKWEKEREGDGIAMRGLKKIASVFASPSQEDWERAKASANWQITRLEDSATAQVCIDLSAKKMELLRIVKGVQADKQPNYGKGITRLHEFEDTLALEWSKAQKNETDPGYSAAMKVYQEVSNLLYSARGVVRQDVLTIWHKEMMAHGLESLKEIANGKKGGSDEHRKAMVALRDRMKGGDGDEKVWGVTMWYRKVERAHSGLATLNLQIEAMPDPLPKEPREKRDAARQAAVEIDKLIAERKIGEALARLKTAGAGLAPLKDATEVKALFKQVLLEWKQLPLPKSAPGQGDGPSTSEWAKLQIEVTQLRMFCSVSGAGEDPTKLPDGLATPELYQRLKALQGRIDALRLQGGKSQDGQSTQTMTPWEEIQAKFEQQANSLRGALKALEAFPVLLLREKMNEKVPAAIKACDAIVEKGAETDSEDTSQAEAEIKKLETLEQEVKALVTGARGGEDAEKRRKTLLGTLDTFDMFFKEAKQKLPKNAGDALKTWLETLEMDSDSLRTLIQTAGADELKSIADQIIDYSNDIAKARQMLSVDKGEASAKAFDANAKKAKELKKVLEKLFGGSDFKDSRAGDFADFSKRLENIEARIPTTEPTRLGQELTQFEQEIETYRVEEEKRIEAARTLLKERFAWLAVVYDRAKGFKNQVEAAKKNGGRNMEAENHLAYLEVVKRTIATFEKELTESLAVTDSVKLKAETIKAEILKLQQNPPQYPTGKALADYGSEAAAFDKARAALVLFQQGALKAIGEYDPRKELAGKLRAALKTGLDELDKTRDAAKAERLLSELKSRLQKGEPSPVSKRGDLRRMLDQHSARWREQTGRFNKEVTGLLQEIEQAKNGEAPDVGAALSALVKRIEPLAGIFQPQAFTRAFDALADASGEKAVARAREPIMATVREVRSLIQSTPAFRVLDGMPFRTKPSLSSIGSVLTEIEVNVMHRHG